MTCRFTGVTISNVVTGANNTATITVTGTLNCSTAVLHSNVVTITYLVAGQSTSQTTSANTTTGVFSFTVTNVPCGADFGFQLKGQCSDSDPVCTQTFKPAITCPPPITCPTSVVLNASGTCNSTGNYDVAYTATFNPPLPQGATGTVFWAYGGTDVVTGQSSASTTLTGGSAVSQLTQSAVLAPSTTGYTSNVFVSFSGSYGSCAALMDSKTLTNLPPCVTTPCPSSPQGPVTITMQPPFNWCAPATAAQGQIATCTATINWPAGVANPPTPIQYNWTVTTPSRDVATIEPIGPNANQVNLNPGWTGAGSNGTGSVDLSAPGTYTVTATPVFAPGTAPMNPDGTYCNLTGSFTFTLQACQEAPPCPSVSGLNTSVGCFDPDSGTPATCTATVTVQNPSPGMGFVWDFGDTAHPNNPGNNQSTTGPSATYNYTSTGTFTVSVQVTGPSGCVQSGAATQSVSVTVPDCPCPNNAARGSDGKCPPPPPPKGGGGGSDGGLGCGLLYYFGVACLALGLFALLLALCMPPLVHVLLAAAGILGGIGIILLAIWIIVCPKPCGWGLLLGAQLSLAVGWVACYYGFGPCCHWLGAVGIGLLLLSGGLFIAWIKHCKPTKCEILKEIALPLVSVVVPVLAIVAAATGAVLLGNLLFAPLAACVNWWVAAIMSIAAGIIATAALACK